MIDQAYDADFYTVHSHHKGEILERNLISVETACKQAEKLLKEANDVETLRRQLRPYYPKAGNVPVSFLSPEKEVKKK
jgi:hypothetical protein